MWASVANRPNRVKSIQGHIQNQKEKKTMNDDDTYKCSRIESVIYANCIVSIKVSVFVRKFIDIFVCLFLHKLMMTITRYVRMSIDDHGFSSHSIFIIFSYISLDKHSLSPSHFRSRIQCRFDVKACISNEKLYKTFYTLNAESNKTTINTNRYLHCALCTLCLCSILVIIIDFGMAMCSIIQQ